MNAGISLSYFVLSLLSLIGLYGALQSVSYGLKSIIYWTRISLLVYGLILCVLALLVFVLEIPRLPDNVTLSWAAMSQYQKDFFNNDKALLQAARQLNSLLVGIFTVVIGVLFIILGALSFKLHAEIGVRMVFDKKQSSRLPVMDNVLQ